MSLSEEEIEQIKQKLAVLKIEHRDLDTAIGSLQQQAYVDQMQMRRMKKRKLFLKDMIHRLESMLIPDMPA
ncbi:hypothetical protein Tel_15725 [Candidatus Tenderia electrophaga]|jgi:hypothetical protein|uniref:DUF465 domain-containing protein n=1 Tax=Candidatus Tenderia electrophaga TaxID=1748243 RepID=A0A0S2TH41_9GAMM|nr:hypothetical protein Tel_15725 [Candidatus Tenderia electrophaga]